MDDARHKFCDRCKQPVRPAGRILLHGHGTRKRRVVVPPFWTGAPPVERCAKCWQRRKRSTFLWTHIMIVMPLGVMPRWALCESAACVRGPGVNYIYASWLGFGNNLRESMQA